jgi:hypothetical protein
MAMGIVSNSEFEKELEKCSDTKTIKQPTVRDEGNARVEIVEKGRGKGNVETPESLRKIIGETSQIQGRAQALELAKNFGISPSSVSAYSNGATSTASYNNPQPELKNHVDNAKLRVSNRARSKLMIALNHITDEKLAEAKVRDLAGIAKDMSVIVKTMEPEKHDEGQGMKSPTFVVFAPQFLKEETFDVIDVKEE